MPRIHDAPFGLTSFAVGPRYEAELDHFLASVRKVYPSSGNLTVLVGRYCAGEMHLSHHDLGTGREDCWDVWRVPDAFVDAAETPENHHSWWTIVRMKGWWMHEIFRNTIDTPLVWIDADAVLHRPLDLELPDGDFLAASWVDFAGRAALRSGTLVVRGRTVLPTLKETARRCEETALRGPRKGHQRILRDVAVEMGCPLIPLPEAYCACVLPDRERHPSPVVEHWMGHLHRIDPAWPPPPSER
jgi:hypothetical protein